MLEILKYVVQNYKKVPAPFLEVVFWAVLLILGVVQFLPEDYAKTFNLNEFRDKYKGFIGISFLCALIFFGVFYLWKIISFCWQLYKQRKILQNLTPKEKGYLFLLIHGNKCSIDVGLEDRVMAGLVEKDITQCKEEDHYFGYGRFSLCPWAQKCLENNLNLLEGYEQMNEFVPFVAELIVT